MNFKYRPEIDGLRAIAVMSVIVFHAGFVVEFKNENFSFLPGGFLGVDIFYVISGYLISYLILEKLKLKSFSFLDFYERRARRLLPVLFLVISVSLAAGYILMLPRQYLELSNSSISSLFFFSNIWFYFSDNYFAESSLVKPLLHTWSLSIEEQFYIFFPPLLVFFYLKKKNINNLFIILIFLSLLFSQFGSVYFKSFNFYMIFSRIWELAFGGLIALVHIKSKSEINFKYRKILEAISFIIIISSFFIFDESTLHPSIFTFIVIFGTGVLIYFRNPDSIIKKILSLKIFVGIGLISYSLYLWHYPIFAFKKIKSNYLSDFDKLEAIFLIIFLSLLSFFLVEKPFRNKKLIKKRNFFFIILLAFISIFSLSIYVNKTNGMPKRYSPEVLELIDFNYDYKKVYRTGICHNVSINKLKNKFFENCKFKINKNKEDVYIWGDSMAGHLFPGINEKYKKKYNIWQRTSGSCKPIIKKSLVTKKDKPCQKINNFILNEIRELKPNKIFLSAFWLTEDLYLLEETIKLLKNFKVEKIYLVGPSPRWHDPLPKILFKEYRIKRKIPEYLYDQNHKVFFKIDKEFEDFSKKNSIRYISPMKILCKSNYKCLTKVGKKGDSLVNWDENHFTEKASIFIFSKVID